MKAAQTFYKTIEIDGLNIFYREAGDASRPVLLLLHGFPSSSHMFRNLINHLSGNYYLIAPDYPGFGRSSAPDTATFNYTFDNLAAVMERFIDRLHLSHIHLYVQNYGGPIGFRIASRRPGLIRSLIIQNANIYLEGLGPALEPLIAYIQNSDAAHEAKARFFLTLEATQWQYLNGAGDPLTISPDSYSIDQYYLQRPGNDLIQLTLFRDYGSNVAKYGEWQHYLRTHQPPTLVIWGKNDVMFIAAGADAYKTDLPEAKIVHLNGGHFALEEHHVTIAELISQFIVW